MSKDVMYEIVKMQYHERKTVVFNEPGKAHTIKMEVRRIPGGWLWFNARGEGSGTFVSFNDLVTTLSSR